MSYFSFRRRFTLYACLLMLLLLLPGGLYLLTQTREAVGNEAGKGARDHLAAVVWSLENRPPFKSEFELSTWAAGFQDRTGIRFSYIRDGRVAVDSEFVVAAQLAPHDDRPEVMQAVEKRNGLAARMSETTGVRYIYAAQNHVTPAGLAPGVVRIAMPEAALTASLDALNGRFFLVMGLTLLLVALLLRRMAGKAFRLFDRMAVSAQAIAQGRYEERLPNVPCLELMPFTAAINAMAANLADRLRGTAEEKNRLLTVLNGLREGVILVDTSCRVRLFNPAAEKFFPALETMRGKSLMEATMLPELETAVAAALVDSNDGSGGSEARGQAAHSVPVKAGESLLEATFIPLDKGERSELVIVLTDIGERDRVDRIRRDFVANVSHELRTPLTSIRGYAEALQDAPEMDPAQRQKFCDIILRNAEHMTRMADGLLTLARTEHAAKAHTLAEIDACAVLRDVLTEMGAYLEERGISLRLSLDDCPTKSLVVGEPGALHELFRNIIENAAKYGKGVIELSVLPTSGFLEFHIRDFGPGIPAASRERVFERFFRLDRATSKSNGSAGLGLAICRHIMRNIQGVIRIDDPADGGPGVVFVLAFRRVQAQAA